MRTESWGLSAALAASSLLLALPAVDLSPGPPGPVPAAMAWSGSQRAITSAELPDERPYTPAIFLDARTSVGVTPSPEGTSTLLVQVAAGRPVRQLRTVPTTANPSFPTFALSGDALVWVEATSTRGLELWSADVRGTRPSRRLTADLGDTRFHQSQYDLVVAGGRVHWVASGTGDTTEVRSVALAGGPVRTRTETGTWQLSAWPWLVNGATDAVGTTRLRNMDTGQEVTPPSGGRRSTTSCSATWCRTVSLADDGYHRIEIARVDGTGRQRVAGRGSATVLTDVVPLERFEVFSETGPDSALTGNVRLLVYDVTTRQTVEISPDAGRIAYLNGVLSWSTGTLDAYLWHAIDLRTV